MRSFLKALQQAMDAATWSRGVRAAREGRVLLPDARPGEPTDVVEAQVLPARSGASRLVVLYLADIEWDCDCQLPACEHAAAAAIAFGQSSEAPKAAPALPPTPALRPPAVVHYAFARQHNELVLTRQCHYSDGGQISKEPIGLSLKVRQLQSDGPRLILEASDMAVEAALAGRALPAALPQAVLHRVLRALCDAPHVSLDARPMRVVESAPAHTVQIHRRAGGDYSVTLCDEALLDEVFAQGVGRRGDALMPLDPVFLSAREQAQLRGGLSVAKDDLPRLLDEVLPRLARQVPIVWKNVSEPLRSEVPVTCQFTLDVSYATQAAHGSVPTLSVLPTIVYAPPLVARVQNDTLKLCGNEIPRRRREDEQALVQWLQRELGMQPQKRTSAQGEAGAALLMRVRSACMRHHFLLHDRGQSLTAFRSRKGLFARVVAAAGEQDDFDLEFVCAAEEGQTAPTVVPAGAVLQAWRKRETSLALADGGFAPLPQRFLHAHAEALQAFVAAKQACAKHRRPPPGWLQARLGELCAALDVAAPPAAQRAMAAWRHVESLPSAAKAPHSALASFHEVALPPGLVLREYQVRGVHWLRERVAHGIGAILADDMGLGKTLQSLLSTRGKTLIVVPTSLLGNWQAEAAAHCPQRQVRLYHGPQRRLPALGDDDIVLTSYGVLRLDTERLCEHSWGTVVLDEANAIKSPHSQAAQAAYKVGACSHARLALSGTPLENRLDELWSLLHFCNPGLFGSLDAFLARYNDAPDSTPLTEALAHVMLRRKKSDVARDLPDKANIVLRCTLSEKEQTLYDALAQATKAQAAHALQQGGSVMDALEALLRLRQAACHPALLPGHRHSKDSAKFAALLEVLVPATHQGHRALVFSQWTQLLDLLEPHLHEAGVTFLRLDGKSKDRAGIVHAFMQPNGPQVLLMSLKAGGVGLNLTAADHVFLLDPWWNPASEEQAADRAHRIGQTRKVLVHRLIAQGTVDERLLQLQAHKKRLAAQSLGDAHSTPATGGQGLGRDELLMLLG